MFSIIIPVHNGEKYIGKTIESILNQTYPHFDLIVLENYSQDHTLEVVYSHHDPRIKVIPSNTFLPIELNWKRILSLELNPYMTVLGSDDLIYPDFLQTILTLIQAEPSAALYQTNFKLIDGKESIIQASQFPYRQDADDFLRSVHEFREKIYGTGFVLRSSDYKRIGGLNSTIPRLIGADHLAWYETTRQSYKVCSPAYGCAIRFHDESTSYSTDLYTLFQAFTIYLEQLEKLGYFHNPEHKQIAYRYVKKNFAGRHHRQLLDLLRGSDGNAWEVYHRSIESLHRIEMPTLPVQLNTPLAGVLRTFAYLPAPIRQLSIRLVEWVGKLTYSLRKR